ncbi:GPI2-domain-containing protein [Lepidopterella palustris CBS 459.81]|uniref:GPI2-domain-containing protein n=1 Tax=Lepidopterella palustris CBS 459.81 TaxID=1314670 RepID=A0A8E2E422_9PEZI|nr:GPI2-domain-containing protein [Lepidopterella palustris CBS 459.81]
MASRALLHHQPTTSDPSRLAPEDAFYATSPPRRTRQHSPLGLEASNGTAVRGLSDVRRRRDKDRGRSGSRRRKGQWKKLLWFKQPYPDNYTDEETFLDHLQRNPRLQPYEFWSLMADSTVIVQHIASVSIFICCFSGIVQERVSPVVVVGWGSVGTVLGWALWDHWVGKEEVEAAKAQALADTIEVAEDASSASSTSSLKEPQGLGLQLSIGSTTPRLGHSHSASATSMNSNASASSYTGHPAGAPTFAMYTSNSPYGDLDTSLSPRNQQRLATAKSAILIYCALLGLSPILKSLTRSTTSDSIWAMSTWLMCMNVFFFDYGGGTGAQYAFPDKFPASLSTNAAVMASTVLASRLPSTTHVFSLTLFSIEVFGLFPIFRRQLRKISWRGHLTLTIILVMGASGGMGAIVSHGGRTMWIVGIVLGSLLTFLGMGICSWWLIGLQKYKNEIHGPWDPARPIIRRHWD